jgi:hypothetical protein
LKCISILNVQYMFECSKLGPDRSKRNINRQNDRLETVAHEVA